MSRRPSEPTVEILRKLVAFDTVSRNSNLALISWVQGYLAEHRIESTLIHDETGKKANLYATIGDAGRLSHRHSVSTVATTRRLGPFNSPIGSARTEPNGSPRT